MIVMHILEKTAVTILYHENSGNKFLQNVGTYVWKTKWPQISEVCNLHTHCCENPKPHSQGLLHGVEAAVSHQPSTSVT
jgi:hypothetical protein